MAGQIHAGKQKITYGEWRKVLTPLKAAAKAEDLELPELLRKITLDYANRFRERKGKKPIVADYRSGKFVDARKAKRATAAHRR